MGVFRACFIAVLVHEASCSAVLRGTGNEKETKSSNSEEDAVRSELAVEKMKLEILQIKYKEERVQLAERKLQEQAALPVSANQGRQQKQHQQLLQKHQKVLQRQPQRQQVLQQPPQQQHPQQQQKQLQKQRARFTTPSRSVAKVQHARRHPVRRPVQKQASLSAMPTAELLQEADAATANLESVESVIDKEDVDHSMVGIPMGEEEVADNSEPWLEDSIALETQTRLATKKRQVARDGDDATYAKDPFNFELQDLVGGDDMSLIQKGTSKKAMKGKRATKGPQVADEGDEDADKTEPWLEDSIKLETQKNLAKHKQQFAKEKDDADYAEDPFHFDLKDLVELQTSKKGKAKSRS